MFRGPERVTPHTGTETRTRLLREAAEEEYWSMGGSLNQPSRVKEECAMRCKLLFQGDKILYVYRTEGTLRISIG